VSIFDFFNPKPAQPRSPGDTDTVRKITEQLDALDPEKARYLAAFAYILSRIARADLKIDAGETREMERIVMEQSGLPEEQAIIAVQIAKHQNLLFGGTENFLVTREFNKISTREQKLTLLGCLFSVAGATNLISVAEDNEIRQVANELGLSHQDFIAIRSRFRDKLAVLKANQ